MASGVASDVTSLIIGDWTRPIDVSADEEAVEQLCRGLGGVPQVERLILPSTGLTDAGLKRVCQTIMSSCRQLTWLICRYNELTDEVEDSVRQTLRDLSGLTINLGVFRLSPGVSRRLKKEIDWRIVVVNQQP